jgi:hypothetical protein
VSKVVPSKSSLNRPSPPPPFKVPCLYDSPSFHYPNNVWWQIHRFLCVYSNKHHDIKTYCQVEVQFLTNLTSALNEGKWLAPAALFPWKYPSLYFEQQAGCVADQVWMRIILFFCWESNSCSSGYIYIYMIIIELRQHNIKKLITLIAILFTYNMFRPLGPSSCITIEDTNFCYDPATTGKYKDAACWQRTLQHHMLRVNSQNHNILVTHAMWRPTFNYQLKRAIPCKWIK